MMQSSSNSTNKSEINVAIIVKFSDDWLGGLNYFRNLISTAREIYGDQIRFTLITGFDINEELLKNFPCVEIIKDSMFDKFTIRWIFRKLWQILFASNPLLNNLLIRKNINILSHSGYLGKNSKIKTIGWIPDFQHHYLYDLFSKLETFQRNKEISRTIALCNRVIVSSYNAKEDLLKYASESGKKIDVVRFAVPRPAIRDIFSLDELQLRYEFDRNYLFLPNQYWMHKNHLQVIQSIELLKKRGIEPLIISTGKMFDYRNPSYANQIVNIIREKQLQDNYIILGVVEYKVVQSLMAYSLCVLNPSRFEGWSTTVEEAKAFNKPTFLSDIPVHKEQMNNNSILFKLDDSIDLANKIEEFLKRQTSKVELPESVNDYTYMDRLKFASSYYISLIKAIQS